MKRVLSTFTAAALLAMAPAVSKAAIIVLTKADVAPSGTGVPSAAIAAGATQRFYVWAEGQGATGGLRNANFYVDYLGSSGFTASNLNYVGIASGGSGAGWQADSVNTYNNTDPATGDGAPNEKPSVITYNTTANPAGAVGVNSMTGRLLGQFGVNNASAAGVPTTSGFVKIAYFDVTASAVNSSSTIGIYLTLQKVGTGATQTRETTTFANNTFGSTTIATSQNGSVAPANALLANLSIQAAGPSLTIGTAASAVTVPGTGVSYLRTLIGPNGSSFLMGGTEDPVNGHTLVAFDLSGQTDYANFFTGGLPNGATQVTGTALANDLALFNQLGGSYDVVIDLGVKTSGQVNVAGLGTTVLNNIAVVPEPTSIAGLALLGVPALARRRRA